MNSKDYFASMKEKFSANYDVYDTYCLRNFEMDLYAHFYARNEKFFASKSATIYAYESNEHTFFKHYASLQDKNIYDFVNELKSSIDILVDPHDEHMSTRLNAVLVTESEIRDSTIKLVRSFKYQKTFLFGLKGWVDICIILVNLSKDEVIASKKARKTAQYFSPVPPQ